MLLKKVWDVDVLKCQKYGGEMKIIPFFDKPFVIRRIRKHLDLWEDTRSPPPLNMYTNLVKTAIHGKRIFLK